MWYNHFSKLHYNNWDSGIIIVQYKEHLWLYNSKYLPFWLHVYIWYGSDSNPVVHDTKCNAEEKEKQNINKQKGARPSTYVVGSF